MLVILDVRSLRGLDGHTDQSLVRARVRIKISNKKYNITILTPQWNSDDLQKYVKRQQYTEQTEQVQNSGKEGNEIKKPWEIAAEIIINQFGKGKRKKAKFEYLHTLSKGRAAFIN